VRTRHGRGLSAAAILGPHPLSPLPRWTSVSAKPGYPCEPGFFFGTTKPDRSCRGQPGEVSALLVRLRVPSSLRSEHTPGAAGAPVTLAMAGGLLGQLLLGLIGWTPFFLRPVCPPSYGAPTTLVLLNIKGQTSGATMTTNLRFRVEADDEDVVVTLDGTKCMVRYVKADNGLNLFHVRGDERSPIHDIHFLAGARQLANAKAKELGWIV
jgi:hypothetical protein